MAQLDNKTTKQRDSSSVPKLKKGQSEPQLTQCEKQTEVQVPQIINSTGTLLTLSIKIKFVFRQISLV